MTPPQCPPAPARRALLRQALTWTGPLLGLAPGPAVAAGPGAEAVGGAGTANDTLKTTVWPQRPIRLMVVYAAGGASDSMARPLAAALQGLLSVPVTVEHRPGAGGSLGMQALARATPDGHTLAFSALSPLSLHPLLPAQAQDLSDRVQPVAGVMRTPVLLLATPAFAGQRFDDLITQARREPGRLRWASSGLATAGHLVLAQVARLSGCRFTHVPYQGGGQPLNDALGGQFEILSTQVAAAQLALIAQGRLRPLAVGARQRVAALPEVPTLAELGLADANLDSLFGVFAPAGLPVARLERLQAAVRQALQQPGLKALLRQSHHQPAEGGAAELAHELAAERARHQAWLRAHPQLLD